MTFACRYAKTHGMRRIRHILGDRSKGGLLLAFLAHALLLQGLLGAFAHGAMAAAAAGPGIVICSPSGMADGGRTDDGGLAHLDLGDACCTVLCRAACAAGPALLAGEIGPMGLAARGHAPAGIDEQARYPRPAGLIADPRGPPPLSI